MGGRRRASLSAKCLQILEVLAIQHSGSHDANWQNEQNEKCLCRFSHSAGRMKW